MIRKSAPLAAVLLAATSTLAIAQSQTTPSPAQPPAHEPPAAATMPPAAAKTTTGGVMYYSHKAHEMRASKLIGTSVVNAANETVGDINEIVLDDQGRVAAVIIGVGGFLGMGEHEVALSFDSLRVERDQNNKLKLVANVTKDSLKNAPQWRWEPAKK
jgi:sporulation protein YlmC with PRC-barrel domain